jgi:hypothetical protein
MGWAVGPDAEASDDFVGGVEFAAPVGAVGEAEGGTVPCEVETADEAPTGSEAEPGFDGGDGDAGAEPTRPGAAPVSG